MNYQSLEVNKILANRNGFVTDLSLKMHHNSNLSKNVTCRCPQCSEPTGSDRPRTLIIVKYLVGGTTPAFVHKSTTAGACP